MAKRVPRRPTKAHAKRSRSRSAIIGSADLERSLEQKGPHSYVALLGLESVDSSSVLRSLKQGLPYRAFERLIANTTFSSETALALVKIPARTLTRRKREGRFHEAEPDRL